MTSTPPSPSTTSATNHPSSSSSPTTGTATATATATSAGAATAPPSKPPSPPVRILVSKPSRVYSFLHPVVLPLLLAARFAPLVADPVAELSGDLPLLAVLQVVFVVVCLPPAGSGYGTGAGAGTGAGSGAAAGAAAAAGGGGAGRRRQHHGKGDSGLSSKVVPALISLTLTTLLATPAFTILLVLFGAPLTTHNFETILCAAHMAVLSATPLVYVHGVDGGTWREIWGVNRPTDAVWGGALGTGVGAWFGAVPIPLDWDRPWQAYPITILTGAYIGYAVGSLISRSSWLYGRRIQFVPEEDQKAEKVE